MAKGQNHALVFLMYLSRLVQHGHLQFNQNNPRAYMLDTISSAVFSCGRDVRDEPYLAVPVKMSYFTQIDWVEAALCRKLGYLFLEARDSQTQLLHMAFGIKVRRQRMDVFCVDGKEDINRMRLNVKLFEQDPNNPRDIVFRDQHELVGISMKEIDGIEDLGTELDHEDARTILGRSGVEGTFTTAKLQM